MSDPQFGCPACQSTNVMVRSETEGFDYDAVLRWDEDGEPAEVEPFDPTPPELEEVDPSALGPAGQERLRRTRFTCWSCGAAFSDPTRVDTLPND